MNNDYSVAENDNSRVMEESVVENDSDKVMENNNSAGERQQSDGE